MGTIDNWYLKTEWTAKTLSKWGAHHGAWLFYLHKSHPETLSYLTTGDDTLRRYTLSFGNIQSKTLITYSHTSQFYTQLNREREMEDLPSSFVVGCLYEGACRCPGSCPHNEARHRATWSQGPPPLGAPGHSRRCRRTRPGKSCPPIGRDACQWPQGFPGWRWGASRCRWGWTQSWRPAPCSGGGGMGPRGGMRLGCGSRPLQRPGPGTRGWGPLQVERSRLRSWVGGSLGWKAGRVLGTVGAGCRNPFAGMAEGGGKDRTRKGKEIGREKEEWS